MDIMYINGWLSTLVFNWYKRFFNNTHLILANLYETNKKEDLFFSSTLLISKGKVLMSVDKLNDNNPN